MKDTKTLNVRADIAERFREYCKDHCLIMGRALDDLLAQWLEEHGYGCGDG